MTHGKEQEARDDGKGRNNIAAYGTRKVGRVVRQLLLLRSRSAMTRGFESLTFRKGHGKAKADGLANRIVGTLIYV